MLHLSTMAPKANPVNITCGNYCCAAPERNFSFLEVSNRLNDILLSTLGGTGSHSYGRPRDAFQALVSTFEP